MAAGGVASRARRMRRRGEGAGRRRLCPPPRPRSPGRAHEKLPALQLLSPGIASFVSGGRRGRRQRPRREAPHGAGRAVTQRRPGAAPPGASPTWQARRGSRGTPSWRLRESRAGREPRGRPRAPPALVTLGRSVLPPTPASRWGCRKGLEKATRKAPSGAGVGGGPWQGCNAGRCRGPGGGRPQPRLRALVPTRCRRRVPGAAQRRCRFKSTPSLRAPCDACQAAGARGPSCGEPRPSPAQRAPQLREARGAPIFVLGLRGPGG